MRSLVLFVFWIARTIGEFQIEKPKDSELFEVVEVSEIFTSEEQKDRTMTNALTIPKQNLIVQTENMVYPVEYREEKPTVPQPFINLLERLSGRELTGNKSEMFHQYANELQRIEKCHKALRRFMNEVCECNVVIGKRTPDVTILGFNHIIRLKQRGEISEHQAQTLSTLDQQGKLKYPHKVTTKKTAHYRKLLEVHLERTLAELPDLNFQIPDTGRAELAAHPDQEFIKSSLEETLKRCWAYLIWMTLQAFDYLTSREMMGVIEWFAPDVARYNFFTGSWLERKLQRRTETHKDSERGKGGTWHTRYTKVEQDMERTYMLTRHTHDVIDAARVLPSTVEMPSNARQAADRIPDYLKDMVEVVTGELVFQQEIQEEISREEWTVKDEKEERNFVRDPVKPVTPVFRSNRPLYKPDPALIIGHYVVTGWV